MNDLTEQWKKGEFIICNAGKCQYYYVQNEEQREVIKTEYCLFDDNTPNWQILAPVPSYKEWVGVKQQRDLENKLRHDSDNKNWQLRTENTQLKELLKECEEVIKNVDTYYGNYDAANGYLVINKIDEALR